MTQKLVELSNVSFSDKEESILSKISLAVYSGEILTIIGPNGAGKSTLLRLILGILKPKTGIVWKLPQMKIGYMPQSLHISKALPLTVSTFLKLKIKAASNDLVESALVKVGATHLVSKQINTLSGGEWQRVLLARAIMGGPELLVLDEPVQGVDINGEVEMYALIEDIAAQINAAVILVSHNLHLVMAKTTRVMCINHHICCEGHPEHVKKDPGFVELFGDNFAKNLALYQHHHNHVHTLKGDIQSDE